MKAALFLALAVAPLCLAELPAPANDGKTYTVTEVKAQQRDLAGKVIRLRLGYNSGSAPEQQADGSQRLFVSGSSSYDFVTFPPEGAAYVRVFQRSIQPMTFFGLVRFNADTIILGRGYDPRKKAYTW
jgi:hypothetical protein